MPDQRLVTIDGKTHAFPADATDAEISAALGAIPASNSEHAPKAKTWTDTAVGLLPAAGAILGGFLGAAGGPPGSIAGAALGGSSGEAYKQLINRARGADVPETSTGAATDIATSGAIAGAMDAGGLAIGAGVKAVAPIVKAITPRDVVGIVSPRIANALKAAEKAVEKAGKAKGATQPSKVVINSTDFVRIKALMDQGIPSGEATKAILALRQAGRLP